MVTDLIRSPWTLLTALVGFLASIAGYLDPVFGFLAATSNTWFPVIATWSRFVAPEMPSIPPWVANKALLIAALVYVTVLADKLLEKAYNKWLN
jgi:hypothetical protein